MTRIVEIDGHKYDVDTERDLAHQALLDSGEQEARIYVRDDEGERATVSVLRDSGTVHQAAR